MRRRKGDGPSLVMVTSPSIQPLLHSLFEDLSSK